MQGLLCTHAPASAHNKYTKPSSIKRQMPPLSPQNLDKTGGVEGLCSWGITSAFGLKPPKKRECKIFSSGTEPSEWGGVGDRF